jgi:putative transposase
MPVHRRVTYRLYPSPAQAAEMERACDLHRGLYNAALQERRDAWRLARKSVGYAEQCRSLTQVRRENPEYLGVNAQSLQVTLKRLDLAFQAFFRRVKAGEAPGFPRFKGRDRFPGFGFKSHGDGFRFTPGTGWRHGRLRLSGIGEMPARGEARTPGRVVSCDVQRKADGWFLSLVLECAPFRERTGDREAGLDWGVETFATLAYSPDEFAAFPNDRPLAEEQERLKAEQKALSKALRGKRSKRAVRHRRLMAKRWRKVANRRKERNHQVTARLAAGHALIVTEGLSVTNMAASAKGTAEKPGKRVKQKAGLNRAILDATPGSFLSFLRYKAAEAGTELIELDPRAHRPSQTDPISGEVRKKALSERTHTLPDGRVIGRDQAAALAMLVAGLRLTGREPAWVARPETPARAA